MGVLEGITHSEEIKGLLEEAQNLYDNAASRLEDKKKATTKSLEKLGEMKLNCWSDDMESFLDAFGQFNSIQMVCKIDDRFDFIGKNETPNELMINMRQASVNASELIKEGALAVGSGALVGIATYGGVSMFAKASTGTAIATLSGVAKKNATLAFLGGGSIKSGGLGMIGGKAILGGVVITAVAGVAALLASSKGKAKLAEAKKINAETKNAVKEIDGLIIGMDGIIRISNQYSKFITNLSDLFIPYIDEMNSISSQYTKGPDGKVDYNELSEMEQKTLHLSWLLAQLYYHVLSINLLTDEGTVTPESQRLLNEAQNEYNSLSGKAEKLEEEKVEISNLLSDAKKMYANSSKKFFDNKRKASQEFIKIGDKRVSHWIDSLEGEVDVLSHFEDIEFDNSYPFSVTDYSAEDIYENSADIINRIKNNSIETSSIEGKMEVALFGEPNRTDGVLSTPQHNMSLWFADKLDNSLAGAYEFCGVSENNINRVKATVQGISGRENLEQSKLISSEVGKLSEKIEDAKNECNEAINRFQKINNMAKKLGKIQAAFVNEIQSIYQNKSAGNAVVNYDTLETSEKKIIQMSMVVADLQYAILTTPIISKERNETSLEKIDDVKEAYSEIKRATFKMKDEDARTADIIWHFEAEKMKYISFVLCFLYLLLVIGQCIIGDFVGLIGILGIIIACPIFFVIKNMSQSKLYIGRIVRMLCSVVIVALVEILVLVG